MAILDNAIWLTGPGGTAQGGSTVMSEGGASTTVTASFTANAWDATQSGYNISEFGAFGITQPITADYQFSNPVEDLSFDLQHVNSSGSTYDDMFTIYAYDEDGNLLPSAEVVAGISGLNQDTIIINADGSVSVEGDGTASNDVNISLAGPISQLQIVLDVGPDGVRTGGAGIGDLSFTIPPPDDIVEGTDGADTIDAGYTGDPEGDLIDAGDSTGDQTGNAGSDDDVVEAGGGDDWVDSGAGDDTVDGGTGSDTIYGAIGDDSLLGGEGGDSLYGNEDNDTLDGGDGSDTLDGGDGDDLVLGGDGDDTVIGADGDDTLLGGEGDDWLRGSVGNDLLDGGEGDDYIWSGFGDDTIVVNNNFGNDTITAEGVDEVNGDVLDLSNVTDDLTIDLSGSNPENGTFSDGTSTASFDEIENIVLGGGADSIVLGNLSGADRVIDFDMSDSGDGTTVDQIDVSAMTSDYGTTPVNAADVVVTDDGNGNAVLTFPQGESITLVGVAPSQVDSYAELVSIGIPCFTPGTLIRVPGGECKVEDIRPGDLVETVDHGPQPVRWVGRRDLSARDLDEAPHLAPVVIRKGAFGNRRRMLVSPQHGMLWRTANGEALIRAKHAAQFLRGRYARFDKSRQPVSYIHLMFDRHQLIYAEGAPTEAFYPGRMALRAMDIAARAELIELFPELAAIAFTQADTCPEYGPPARRYLKGREIRSHLQSA